MNDCGKSYQDSESELPKEKMNTGDETNVRLDMIVKMVQGLDESVLSVEEKQVLVKSLTGLGAQGSVTVTTIDNEKTTEASSTSSTNDNNTANPMEVDDNLGEELKALLSNHQRENEAETDLSQIVADIVRLFRSKQEELKKMRDEGEETKAKDGAEEQVAEGAVAMEVEGGEENKKNTTEASSSTSTTTPSTTTPISTTTPMSTSLEPESTESSSSTSADTTPTTPEQSSDTITQALDAIEKALPKKAVMKSCLNAILKLLSNLQKRPTETKNLKLLKKNFVIKKYVLDVDGALVLMKACGYVEITEGKKDYLLIKEQSEINTVNLSAAIKQMADKLNDTKEAIKEAPKKAVKRVKCLGGCGFWGDENTEDYCSLCHKNKVCGIKETKDSGKCKCGNFAASGKDGMCNGCFTTAAKNKPKEYKKKLKRAMTKIKCIIAFKSAPRLLQTNKSRCWGCKRKIGILGIQCKCGFIFCGEHRYPDTHKCTFDHRHAQQHKIRKDNQQIKSSKFDAI